MAGGAPDVGHQASYAAMPGGVPGASQPSAAYSQPSAPYPYPPPMAPGQYPPPAQHPYPPPQGQQVPGQLVYPQGSYAPGAAPGTMMMMVPAPAQPQALPHYWPGQSISVWCPHCQGQVDTRIMFNPGLGTWLIAGGICLVGGIFGCCLIPFCVDGLKDCQHSCPKCNRYLGQHKMV